MPNTLLQVMSVIAAGVVAKPGVDLDEPEKVAEQIAALAAALIAKANEKSA